MNTFDPPKLDETEEAEIGKFISETEILKAIDEQKDAKSPGEDGITCEFYKKKLREILLQYYLKSITIFTWERTGLMVRASASGSGDPGSILGRVGVLFP